MSGSTRVLANQKHFDDVAPRYDSMNALRERVMHDIVDAILDEYDFDEDATVLLDFACGCVCSAEMHAPFGPPLSVIWCIEPVKGSPSLFRFISQQLAEHCKEVVGVDGSANMVAQYNLKVANQGIPPTEMYAICSTLSDDDHDKVEKLLDKQVDIIVCVLGYHHFEAIGDVTRRLAKLLKPSSGVIIVVDHLRSQEPSGATTTSGNDPNVLGHNHGSGTVAHPGESEIRAAFASAPGLKMDEFTFRPITTFKKASSAGSVFLAKAPNKAVETTQ
ncbi:hypothetical protein FRB96_005208 [Tulasnella sp. 330]|nr:hypothetical protein FRB96_005208 [Tulasnella sp. 330]KAG8884872.1 hypothetical protein FRB97_003079 [Tulasnella sp. 331]KAG8890130.1 hypothetical protein FRB98_000858 [Tulasnella sp. 332]